MTASFEYDTSLQFPPDATQVVLADLALRLDRGLAIIEQRASAGQSVSRLEEHWISLLQEYERVFDSLN